jgi:hypothetical protein
MCWVSRYYSSEIGTVCLRFQEKKNSATDKKKKYWYKINSELQLLLFGPWRIRRYSIWNTKVRIRIKWKVGSETKWKVDPNPNQNGLIRNTVLYDNTF